MKLPDGWRLLATKRQVGDERTTMEENNETITLKPKRGGGGGVSIWATLIFVLFVLSGIWLVVGSHDVLAGWLSIIFFGSMLAWGEAVLIPGAYYIQLTKDNFIQCKFWRIETVSWADIERFDISEYNVGGRNQMVLGYVFTDEYKKDSVMVKIRESAQTVDGSIQVNCGKPIEELCQYLNEKLDEYRSNNGR